jgi:hypothetical protein
VAKPRSHIQRSKDRQTAAELYLKGWSKSEIARYLEVAVSTVARDLESIQKQWKLNSVRDFDIAREEEIQKLQLLEREYWDAWERSQQDKQTSISEQLNQALAAAQTAPSLGKRLKTATRTETKTGEVAYLNGVNKCIEQRCKLLGLHLQEVPSDSANNTLRGYLNYIVNSHETSDPDHPVCK